MTETTTPSVEGDRLTLAVALRRLGVERQIGHCGEENSEIKARRRHNEAVEVVLDALSALPCKGGEATDEMVEAGVEYWHNTEALLDDMVRGLYRAMTAATPTTEADTGRGLREALEKLETAINEPSPGDEPPAVRNFRHALWPKFEAVVLAALSDTPRGRDSSSREALTHPKVDVGPLPHAITEKCQTCDGHGLIGGFQHHAAAPGYDVERCPDCNPGEI